MLWVGFTQMEALFSVMVESYSPLRQSSCPRDKQKKMVSLVKAPGAMSHPDPFWMRHCSVKQQQQ